MNILILGGTGAMGSPLVNILSKDNTVWVTSRKQRISNVEKIIYVQGNALRKDFLERVCQEQHWDAIIDFMVRSKQQLGEILPFILSSTNQYVFISSARVYSECEGPISETTPRLLESSQDKEFLKTNEYSLSKAREEDLLLKSKSKNFTIIRPSITYNTNRLQLGTMEKEDFLYRYLHGRKIVFSNDLKNKITTMTFGDDVARGIASIVGKQEALGEIYHITTNTSLTWGEVLQVYSDTIESKFGKRPEVIWTDKTTNFGLENQLYRIIYCRYFNRSFDNSKIEKFVDVDSFTKPQDGLKKCLESFLMNPKFGRINWKLEGINDRVTGDRADSSEIKSFSDKVWYFSYRYDIKCIKLILKMIINYKKRK